MSRREDDLYPCLKLTPRKQVVAKLLAFLALVHAAVCRAQVCPIKIEGVSKLALTSEMGIYGYAIKVTYHNVSPFAVRGIEFGVQALSTNNGISKPSRIIAIHELASDAVDSLLWNATAFELRNDKRPIDIIWPAVIVLEDGSKVGGSAALCGYRTEEGNTSARLLLSQPSPRFHRIQVIRPGSQKSSSIAERHHW